MTEDQSRYLSTDSTNVEFASAAYRILLGREPDPGGLTNCVAALDNGSITRALLLADMAQSVERWMQSAQTLWGKHHLPNLIEQAPDRYKMLPRQRGQGESRVLRVKTPEDYDWIERHIYDDGYYEGVHGWILVPDKAFSILADMVVEIGGSSVLEIGCSTGQIIGHLKNRGWRVNGLDISHLNFFLAPYEVRKTMIFGDLLDVELPASYDVIMGLDVFEHLNPLKIARYIDRCLTALNPRGAIFANIPMFGNDRVFGSVFPTYFDAWDQSPTGLFDYVEVDELGWPNGGHIGVGLVTWWEAEFNKHGLVRDIEKEMTLHHKFADYFATAPARKTFFVLRRG